MKQENGSVWDRIAHRYHSLWVQKYSLSPTRKAVVKRVLKHFEGREIVSLLDMGCGVGQLLRDLYNVLPNYSYTGVDKSRKMTLIARKNVPFANIIEQGAEKFCEPESYDIVTCCHSLPYYAKKGMVIKNIADSIKPGGYAIFAQASINNLYDKIVMGMIEKTAAEADYMSRERFIALVRPYFEVVETFTIKEKNYVPNICGFVLKKKA